ncbi:MAG: hypothetical protein MAG581_00002 [Deltaproteobacteria bacterium]|jgi:hypothetical protein|nr:hypothetical protein [Deltaproteobacteria bacterium]
MDVFKRYAISFSIAGLILYFFTIWVEKKNDGMMPHNLSDKTEEKVAITLPPKRYFEKCLDIKGTQQLKYSFSSEDLVSFNLHYHDQGDKLFALKEDSVAELEHTFKPEKRAYYCLMWGNSGKEKVKMQYQFSIQNRSTNND